MPQMMPVSVGCERLKMGDPDMTDKVLAAMPAAAKQYRDQIKKGLHGNLVEAGRARMALRPPAARRFNRVEARRRRQPLGSASGVSQRCMQVPLVGVRPYTMFLQFPPAFACGNE
jgi:hypothetical protein